MFGIAKVLAGLNLPGGIANALMGVPADPRKEFCAILLATAAAANNKTGFNLETEINDLWVRLRNIDKSGSGSLMQTVQQSMQGLGEFDNGVIRALQSLK